MIGVFNDLFGDRPFEHGLLKWRPLTVCDSSIIKCLPVRRYCSTSTSKLRSEETSVGIERLAPYTLVKFSPFVYGRNDDIVLDLRSAAETHLYSRSTILLLLLDRHHL